jgi:hypothetical protein
MQVLDLQAFLGITAQTQRQNNWLKGDLQKMAKARATTAQKAHQGVILALFGGDCLAGRTHAVGVVLEPEPTSSDNARRRRYRPARCDGGGELVFFTRRVDNIDLRVSGADVVALYEFFADDALNSLSREQIATVCS